MMTRTVSVERSDGGGLEQSLTELSKTVPDFPSLEEKAGALLVSFGLCVLFFYFGG